MLRRLWMLSSPFATFSPTEQASWDGSWPWLGVLGSQVFCSEMLGLWVCWWSDGCLSSWIYSQRDMSLTSSW
jgi:hypothetical protein